MTDTGPASAAGPENEKEDMMDGADERLSEGSGFRDYAEEAVKTVLDDLDMGPEEGRRELLKEGGDAETGLQDNVDSDFIYHDDALTGIRDMISGSTAQDWGLIVGEVAEMWPEASLSDERTRERLADPSFVAGVLGLAAVRLVLQEMRDEDARAQR